jgi:PAS domain S-box-containing protein
MFGDGRELEKLEIAMEAAGMAWWWMELPAGTVFFSPNKAHLLGREPSDFVHYKNFTDLVHPDDYEPMMQDMRDHLEGRKDIYETTYRIQVADGSWRTFLDKGKIVAKTKKDISLAGMVVDVTDLSHLAPK